LFVCWWWRDLTSWQYYVTCQLVLLHFRSSSCTNTFFKQGCQKSTKDTTKYTKWQ
jgi:hypothetical protein